MHYTVADFVLDCLHNSLEAKADRVEVEIRETDRNFRCEIRDDGKGIDGAMVARVTDPYVSDGGKHPERKQGLGLAFLAQTLDLCNGRWEIESELGSGTTLKMEFPLDHLDCPPVGDMADVFFAAMTWPGEHDLAVHRTRRRGEYTVRRSELVEALGDLQDAGNLALARRYLRSQESGIEEEE